MTTNPGSGYPRRGHPHRSYSPFDPEISPPAYATTSATLLHPTLPPRPPGRVPASRQRRRYDPLRRDERYRLEQLDSPRRLGDAYNTTNHNHSAATTIQHASNFTLVSQGASDDLLLFETLPRHPDISAEWGEFVPNSRDSDIGKIRTWIDSPVTKELVFWIHGPDGIGKSMLACQLKDDLRSRNRLAASLFLSRLSADWGPETIIRLIGGEIGRTHRKAVPTVAEAVRQCHGASLGFHVEKFVRDPLLALQLPHPLIVIIDGITEWTSHAHFIKQLAHLSPYTSLVRFIMLGRSKPAEDHYKPISIQSCALGPVSVEVMAAHLHAHFNAIEWEDGGRPAPDDVLRLAGLAEGQFTRMEEVVSTIRDLPPSEYDDISDGLHSEAESAQRSSEESSSTDELDYSILLHRVGLAFRPPGHPERHCSLNALAAALDSRYRISQSTGDLIECILLHREALALRPPGHPDRHYSCYNLAIPLHDCFLKDGLVGDLDEAITLGGEALMLRPEGHPRRFPAVNNQRLYLYDRFKSKGAVEDLQEAIALAEEAFTICPKDDPNCAELPSDISLYKSKLARERASSDDTNDSDEP